MGVTRGRPSTGTKVQVRIPADLLATLDLEAEMHDVSRAELIRGIVAEWVAKGYGTSYNPSTRPVGRSTHSRIQG